MPTKDGHLVCRHENDITATTNVADHPEFAGRKTTKTVDGTALTGWFTEDFTLAELKTLRAKERIPQTRQRNTLYDGRWQVPAFEDVLKWADEQSQEAGPSRVAAHRDQAPHLLPQAGPGAGAAAGQAAACVRAPPRALAELRAVLRAQQHPAAEEAGGLPRRLPAGRADLAPLGLRRGGRPADGRRPGQARGPEVDGRLRRRHRAGGGPGHPEEAGRQPRRADHAGTGRARGEPRPAPVHHAQREHLPARSTSSGGPTPTRTGTPSAPSAPTSRPASTASSPTTPTRGCSPRPSSARADKPVRTRRRHPQGWRRRAHGNRERRPRTSRPACTPTLKPAPSPAATSALLPAAPANCLSRCAGWSPPSAPPRRPRPVRKPRICSRPCGCAGWSSSAQVRRCSGRPRAGSAPLYGRRPGARAGARAAKCRCRPTSSGQRTPGPATPARGGRRARRRAPPLLAAAVARLPGRCPALMRRAAVPAGPHLPGDRP